MKALKTLIPKEVGPDLMLYDPEADAVHILNSTARLIFSLCREGKTVDEIEKELQNHFAVEGNGSLTDDIRQCMEDFRNKGLVAEME